MNSQLPLWVSYLQALSTPAIAILAVVIGIMQWRTAHQRAVLDLFDRRMSVYTSLRRVISKVVTTGNATNEDTTNFLRARDGAEFLFGSEVNDYLESIYNALLDFHVVESELKMSKGRDRKRMIEKRRFLFEKISGFFGEFQSLLEPYVRMRQTAPPF